MKTTLTLFLLFISLVGKSQTSDLMFMPEERSLVATYNNNYNGFGFYVGAFVSTIYSQYTYTTPQSRMNRIGLSLSNRKVSVMAGVYGEARPDNIHFKPDVWLKVHPLRILTNLKNIPDATIGVNYVKEIQYGFGISIPF